MKCGRSVSAAVALGLAFPAFARDLTVDLNGGGDFTNIQPAIDAATTDNWTITVEPGEYLVREPLSFKGKSIRVLSSEGYERTTIRMAEDAAVLTRRSVVVFENGETRSAVLRGFTVTGGSGTLVGDTTYGGGIYCDRASPTIEECHVVLNGADRGGGIAGVTSSIRVVACTVEMNVAAVGGGLFLAGGMPTLSSCAVRVNRGGAGGGAYLAGDVTLGFSTIACNTATSKGGGLACVGGILLKSCVVAGNRADVGAGISIGTSGAPMVVVNCTISGNAGDGVSCDEGGVDPLLVNCIVWPESFCGRAFYCLTDQDPAVVRQGVFDFNRFKNVAIGGASVELPDFVIEEPDFALRPGSPAIDAGTSEGTPWNDIVGAFRIDDPRTPNSGSGPVSFCDIGAYEYTTIRLWLEEGMSRDRFHEIAVVGSWALDEMQGWSWGLCHDVDAASIGACAGTGLPLNWENPCDPDATDACDGDPPRCPCPEVACPDDILTTVRGGPLSFNSIWIYDRGITQGVIVDFMEADAIPARERFEFLRITFQRKAPEARLEFCESLGEPPVNLVFISMGMSFKPFAEGMTLAEKPFRRGDANSSGAIDIADTIFTLSHLFSKGAPPACRDAADANDDGRLDIGDAISILNHLFGPGEPLPAPFDECGLDATVDDWGCGSFAPCQGP